MKKLILISSILFFFSLAVNAQTVNEDNIMDYVEKIEVEYLDNHTVYNVYFKDGKSSYIAYRKSESAYYTGTNTFSERLGTSKQKAIYWLWTYTH